MDNQFSPPQHEQNAANNCLKFSKISDGAKNSRIGNETHISKTGLTQFLFSYIFLIFISTPLIFSFFRQDFSINVWIIGENRNLANAPDFKSTPIRELPKAIDQYLKDRMPFRQVFMPGYVYVYENLLKTYVVECVTGTGREIFVNHVAPVIDASLEIQPFSLSAKEHVRLTAAGKYAYFFSKDIPYYLFLAPDKTTLYPEFLPFYASWIPHRTWYEEQVETLGKAHIKFFPLNDYLKQFKDNGRMYDIVFDNGHWNGNALVHAYDYMAKILSKDNQLFTPVPYGEYYGIEELPVTFSVYGGEKTSFIKLKHTENFSCSTLPEQYRAGEYNKLCINNAVSDGSLWFFSDSYFGQTHGSEAITPFVHNVHTYIHRHYGMAKPFTQLADETLPFNRPNAVVEEFVERMGGPQHTWADPKLRILGDFWMKTNGILLDYKTDLSKFILQDIVCSDNVKDEVLIGADNRLSLKESAVADDLGRVVVMGKLNAPSNAAVRIIYSDESGANRTQDFGIAQGAQLFHETIHVKPFSKIKLSLRFLTPGKYRLEKIQEIDDLRERM